ncbi:hypothetical protein GIB67_010635 [Kingdonia uniflora]|uniref:non-specific serine/threonine protein kinase n=1 Tax=Kingdonia uniflora TaxID=39325 RepID=A0A7J7NQT1_9MAGN|nr:hypothetical protein GIB67_010635 [Kingdonia uniflora]
MKKRTTSLIRLMTVLFSQGSAKECESTCIRNCAYLAYSYSGGCSIWSVGLQNLKQLSVGDSNGTVIYIRLATSDLLTFKGALSDSSPIAVKMLEGFRQGENEFQAEVSTLKIVQHVNLVYLRGFCSEGTKRLLVYDYMPFGSLDIHLFGKNSKTLEGKMRYQIALGTTRGLAYLHEECRNYIIHCYIKPKNILLEVGSYPKVADFGLAKVFGHDFRRVLITVRRTRGYIAPERIFCMTALHFVQRRGKDYFVHDKEKSYIIVTIVLADRSPQVWLSVKSGVRDGDSSNEICRRLRNENGLCNRSRAARWEQRTNRNDMLQLEIVEASCVCKGNVWSQLGGEGVTVFTGDDDTKFGWASRDLA